MSPSLLHAGTYGLRSLREARHTPAIGRKTFSKADRIARIALLRAALLLYDFSRPTPIVTLTKAFPAAYYSELKEVLAQLAKDGLLKESRHLHRLFYKRGIRK